MLDCRIHLGSLGLDEFERAPYPFLDLLKLAPILELIYLLFHFKALVSLNLKGLPYVLNLQSCLVTHPLDRPPKVLYL